MIVEGGGGFEVRQGIWDNGRVKEGGKEANRMRGEKRTGKGRGGRKEKRKEEKEKELVRMKEERVCVRERRREVGRKKGKESVTPPSLFEKVSSFRACFIRAMTGGSIRKVGERGVNALRLH